MEAVHTISTQSRPVGYYLRPLTLLRTFWAHRDLIRLLTWREVVSRYRGAALGLVWSLLLPLAMLTVYTFVFSVVLEAKWPVRVSTSKFEFALTLFAGMFLYALFAESVGAACGVIVANASYVKRVVFPLEILPIVKLGAALIHALISFLILMVAVQLFLGHLSVTLGYFPIVLLPLLMLTLGLSWFLASVGVYLRDTSQVVGVLLSILFFMTPIFYPLAQVPPDLPLIRLIMQLNPLTGIVENARRTLLWSQPPEWTSLGITLVLSAAAMQLGYVWFMKTKRGFADVL